MMNLGRKKVEDRATEPFFLQCRLMEVQAQRQLGAGNRHQMRPVRQGVPRNVAREWLSSLA